MRMKKHILFSTNIILIALALGLAVWANSPESVWAQAGAEGRWIDNARIQIDDDIYAYGSDDEDDPDEQYYLLKSEASNVENPWEVDENCVDYIAGESFSPDYPTWGEQTTTTSGILYTREPEPGTGECRNQANRLVNFTNPEDANTEFIQTNENTIKPAHNAAITKPGNIDGFYDYVFLGTYQRDPGHQGGERYVNTEGPENCKSELIKQNGSDTTVDALFQDTGGYTGGCSLQKEFDNLRVANSQDSGDDGSGPSPGDPGGPGPGDDGNQSENEEESSCEGEGLAGFLACDVIITITEWVESLLTTIVEFLFKPDLLEIANTDQAEYQVWSNVRDIANALLGVAFMIIIFSLAFSINVDAYTIKRLLPKLLTTTIAIQASFVISALMVDVSIVLGEGLEGLTNQVLGETLNSVNENWGVEENIGGAVTSVGLGAVAAVGMWKVFAGFAFIAPVLGSVVLLALLVVFGVFLIVALRELFIFLFVVLSPIFFLANLLPATEKFFKFWWSNFTRLLLMYPFMILMVQLGNIAALTRLIDSSPPDDTADSLTALLDPFMAILLQLAGLIGIFFAFKIGGSVMSMAFQGASRLTRTGAGKSGGKGGAQGQGLLGKIRHGISQREGERAAGYGGNKASRILASPKAAWGRNQKLPGGDKTAAQKAFEFNQSAGEAGKTIEGMGLDPDALEKGSQLNLGNWRSFENSLKSLGVSENDEHNLRQKFRHLVGSSNSGALQTALAQQAASAGKATNGTFQQLDERLSGNPALQDMAKGRVAKASEDGGRPDVAALNAPQHAKKSREQAYQDTIAKMDGESLRKLKTGALGKWNDNGVWEPTEFGQKLAKELATNPNMKGATLNALSPASGASGEIRDALKQSFARAGHSDDFEQLLNEARGASGGSGGGTGPSGPAGPSGSAGPGGPQGPQGSPGGGLSGGGAPPAGGSSGDTPPAGGGTPANRPYGDTPPASGQGIDENSNTTHT